jgi:hypothetical protein
VNERNYRLSESSIPDGYQIYEERLPIHGITFRKENALSFINSNSNELEFEREPLNEHDANAIKVIGIIKKLFGKKRLHLGYVPRELAEKIVSANFDTLILPRLHKTYVGQDDYVEIDFQILGPKGRLYEYNPPSVENAENVSDYVPKIKQLTSENRLDEAISLLSKCVSLTEKESEKEGFGVAPWYYHQLAIIYRKRKKIADELLILERYESQKKAPGKMPAKLALRLEKVRKLAKKK